MTSLPQESVGGRIKDEFQWILLHWLARCPASGPRQDLDVQKHLESEMFETKITSLIDTSTAMLAAVLGESGLGCKLEIAILV